MTKNKIDRKAYDRKTLANELLQLMTEDSRVIEIKNKLKDNEENPKLNIIKIII